MKNEKFNFFSFIKSIFLNGLLAIFPFGITVICLTFTYNLMAKWLAPIKTIEPTLLQTIPGSEFFIFILFIMFIGILLKFLIIGPIIHYFEKVVSKIPIINSIYSGAKILGNFFNSPTERNVERKVVLIRYPRDKYYNIAFLLGTASGNFDKLIDCDEEYFKVFMPNTPNPSSGYFFILPKSEIIETNITFEEAIKTIVSCGLITPESIKGRTNL